jgi:hypothetical protein
MQHIQSEQSKHSFFFVSVSNVSAVRSATLSKPANGYVPAETAALPADVLVISCESVSEFGQSHLRVRIQCDSMDLAGELLQDMVKYFKIDELESVADFPQEYQKFEEVLKRVADCNAARMSLAADMADDSQRIKVSSLAIETSSSSLHIQYIR